MGQWDLGPSFSVCLECIDERADDDDDSDLKRERGRTRGRDERTANDSTSLPSKFVPSLSAFYCLFTAYLAPPKKMTSERTCLLLVYGSPRCMNYAQFSPSLPRTSSSWDSVHAGWFG